MPYIRVEGQRRPGLGTSCSEDGREQERSTKDGLGRIHVTCLSAVDWSLVTGPFHAHRMPSKDPLYSLFTALLSDCLQT